MKYVFLSNHLFYVKWRGRSFLIQTYPFRIFSLKNKKSLSLLKKVIIEDEGLIFNKDYLNYVSLELILTSRCNLACDYCYAKREDVGYYGLPRMDMSKKVAKRSIDFVLKQLLLNMRSNNSKEGIFDIYFMGGEPLLNKKCLFFAMNYLKDKVTELKTKGITIIPQAAISTNGTLIDENISKFFKRFDFTYVGVTIDGENHDKYRVYKNKSGTLEDIKQNIKFLEKYGVNLKLLSVVPPGNVKEIDKILDYYKKNGLLDVAFRVSIVPRAPTFQELDRSCVIPKEFLAGYTKSNKDINYSQAEKRLYSKKIIEIADKYNIDERDISKKIMQAIKIGGCLHHCPAGICKISVTPDGSIYPCHQFVNINPYYMGNIFKRRSNLYERVSKRLLNRTVFKLDKCGKCVFQTICPPLIDCPARSYHEKKSLYKTPQYCEMYYKYVERTFERFLKELMGGYNGKMGKDSGFFLYL